MGETMLVLKILMLLLPLNGIHCSHIQANKFVRNTPFEEDDNLIEKLMNEEQEKNDADSKADSPLEKILNVNKRYRNQELFQGDIKLNKKDAKFITSSSKDSMLLKRNAARDRRRLWVNRIVPYEITEDLIDHAADIKAALDDISQVSCIKFVEHKDEKHWIKFVEKLGCWSFVGRLFFSPGPQELSLGPGCIEVDTITHEVMHALGFMHEQSRPDRDQYVTIYWENIKEGFEDNFGKQSGDKIDTQNVQYDYDSIMHYGRRIFAKDRRHPTIEAIGDKTRALGSNRLSKIDIIELNLLYNCKDSPNSTEFLSSWSEFGPCDKSCKKSRQRFCHSENASKCPNVDEFKVETQTQNCTAQECNKPIDGHWGRWTSWSPCDVECGRGRRRRTRLCDDPKPRNNGANCTGNDVYFQLCKAKPCSLGSYDCQFEFGFCEWMEDSGPGASYQWRRHSGSTSSHATGPDNDHTFGNKPHVLEIGHYLYTEASSPAETGDIAVLQSQEFPPTTGQCMSFWYHMFGEDIGCLEVHVRDEKTGKSKQIWTLSGDQGDQWKEANVTIKSSDIYRITFEATRGDGFKGDIAIDDVIFWNGSCLEEPATTTPSPIKVTQIPTTLETTTKVPTTLETTTKVPTTPHGIVGVEQIGCYRDWGSINGRRPFPYYIDMRLDIDWWNMGESFKKIIQKCRNEVAKRQQFQQIFAIQFFGECWFGQKGDTHFERDGRLPMHACFKGLVGRSFSMMTDIKIAQLRDKSLKDNFITYIYTMFNTTLH
eukprot:gene13852-15300_t